jgi:hypothetical protein
VFVVPSYDVGVVKLHAGNQPSSLTRLPCMLVLVLGIIWMHALTVAVGHDAGSAVATGHEQMASASHNHGAAGMADQSCPGDGCGNHHTAFHACVFVLSITAFAVGLVMLCWIGIGRAPHATSKLRHRWVVRERSPPWTVLSLPELSMLRI